jgi:hypothetical protein
MMVEAPSIVERLVADTVTFAQCKTISAAHVAMAGCTCRRYFQLTSAVYRTVSVRAKGSVRTQLRPYTDATSKLVLEHGQRTRDKATAHESAPVDLPPGDGRRATRCEEALGRAVPGHDALLRARRVRPRQLKPLVIPSGRAAGVYSKVCVSVLPLTHARMPYCSILQILTNNENGVADTIVAVELLHFAVLPNQQRYLTYRAPPLYRCAAPPAALARACGRRP